jgi:hypothetical protein
MSAFLRPAPAVLLLSAFLVPGACAQPPEVAVGQRVEGRLEASDPTLDDDSHYDLWTFRGSPGERVTITLRSQEFDAYLTWGVWDGRSLADERSDDDSGGGSDARLTVTVDGDGRYAIRANSYGGGETGAYVLTLEPSRTVPVTVRPIMPGQRVNGTLDESDPLAEDDSWFDLYQYRGVPGERVTATLRSQEFDAYLSVGAWDGAGFAESASDDDGAGDTDATLSATVGGDGTLAIRANSLRSGERGAYTLLLEREPGAGTGPRSGAAVPPGATPRAAPLPGRATGPGLLPAEAVPPTTLVIGQALAGRLEADDLLAADGSHYDLYLLPPQAEAGGELAVTLASSDFDAYLTWGMMEEEGFRALAFDDDGGGGTDARLLVTVETSATYAIRANSLKAGVTGAYTLTVLPSGR